MAKPVLKLTIYMEPVAKGRPRVVRTKGGGVHAFTPDKTTHAEFLIAQYLLSAGIKYDKGAPLHVKATFYRRRPKSSPKRVRLPVSRPDLPNYFSLLADALQRVMITDDAEITAATIRKRFAAEDTMPRIELELEEDIE